MSDDDYEDFGTEEVPDDYCPFHPHTVCEPADHLGEDAR